jgi:hypothetical protein
MSHAEALPHGQLDEVFPDIFFVTGAMTGEFFGSPWQFGRNMTVVREGDELTLINAVRLDDAGLAQLDALGEVTNVVRIGSLHGRDDAFYVDRGNARYWSLRGAPPTGVKVDEELAAGALPVRNASLFSFEHTKLPEAILRLDRDGGIMIACDALQNWAEPDAFTDAATRAKMQDLGFFTPANLGVAWQHVNEPKAEDFVRLKEISFKHALCGHGAPLRDVAQAGYHATFKRVFDI